MAISCVTPMAIRTLASAINVCMTLVMVVFAFYSFAEKSLSSYDLLGWYYTPLAMLGLVLVQLLAFVYAELVPDTRPTPDSSDPSYPHLSGRKEHPRGGGFAWRFEPGAKHETWEQLTNYLIFWLLTYIFHYLFDGHQPYTITGDVSEDTANAATWRTIMAVVIILGMRLVNLHAWIWTYILGTILFPVRFTGWLVMGVAAWSTRTAGYLFGHRVEAYDQVEMSGGRRWGDERL